MEVLPVTVAVGSNAVLNHMPSTSRDVFKTRMQLIQRKDGSSLIHFFDLAK